MIYILFSSTSTHGVCFSLLFLNVWMRELWNLVLKKLNMNIFNEYLIVINRKTFKLTFKVVGPGATIYATLATIKTMCSTNDKNDKTIIIKVNFLSVLCNELVCVIRLAWAVLCSSSFRHLLLVVIMLLSRCSYSVKVFYLFSFFYL